jgi:hypothetical protein
MVRVCLSVALLLLVIVIVTCLLLFALSTTNRTRSSKRVQISSVHAGVSCVCPRSVVRQCTSPSSGRQLVLGTLVVINQ